MILQFATLVLITYLKFIINSRFVYMLKTSPILSIICGLLILVACNNDKPIKVELSEDEKYLASIAGENYEDLIRLPVDPNGDIDTNSMAKISFLNKTYDFDTIVAGQDLRYTYRFVNAGVKDLYITDSRTSCGCAVSKHSSQAIPPGEQGYIDVTFDSKDRKGYQEKIIRVFTNSYPSETLLKLKGFVNSPSQ